MSNFNDLVKKFIAQQNAIVAKGGTVNVAHTNPSPDELIDGINSIETNRPQITAANGYAIIVAERPNITIKLYKGTSPMGTQNTSATTGGYVTFTVATTGQYTAYAYDADNNELWQSSCSVTEPGVFNIKSGLPLESYTWNEINVAAKNDYAKYMFNLWDTKKLTTFMGSTSDSYRTAYIIGFGQDNKVTGGRTGITFMLKTSSSTYKHWNTAGTNDNGISWVGSLIRQNCLKNSEDYYTFDKSVTSETVGTYYVFDDVNNEFVAQTLPDNYVETQKYYTKQTKEADGAFIAGLPAEMLDYIVQVKKKTWSGYGGEVQNSAQAGTDNTIIETNDWMFILSDSEVFGDSNRYVDYSKFLEEGETYQAFKNYNEDRFRFGDTRWLRSPYVPSSPYFCFWGSFGYVNYSGVNTTCRLALCFCL